MYVFLHNAIPEQMPGRNATREKRTQPKTLFYPGAVLAEQILLWQLDETFFRNWIVLELRKVCHGTSIQLG